MLAMLLFAVSLAALVHFYLAYTRSIIAGSRELGLSAAVSELFAGKGHHVGGDEFSYILQLVKLCPESPGDGAEIHAVKIYFGLLNALRVVARAIAPNVTAWIERERAGCAYVAALALDRRVALHCELLEDTARSL